MGIFVLWATERIVLLFFEFEPNDTQACSRLIPTDSSRMQANNCPVCAIKLGGMTLAICINMTRNSVAACDMPMKASLNSIKRLPVPTMTHGCLYELPQSWDRDLV